MNTQDSCGENVLHIPSVPGRELGPENMEMNVPVSSHDMGRHLVIPGGRGLCGQCAGLEGLTLDL